MSEPLRINDTKYGYYIEGGNIGILEQNKETGKFDSVTYKYLQDSQSRMEQEK